ncbi:MAG: CDP-alcohol phosphatidyltransferase family protein [Firmicutes bacterium]|nr:CDP-alcohol phosphatidyltransferase family protein [Bacillota bacterium]
MHNEKWKNEIFTIPNLLSLFRLMLIPIYISLYLRAKEPRQFHIAGIVLAISCLTDAIDGKIARRFHMISTLGIILDPLADKVTQFTLILCLASRYPVLNPVLSLFLFKECFQIVMGIFHLHQGKMLPGALFTGKVCTVVLFITLLLLVIFPEMNRHMINVLAVTDLVFLSLSLTGYFFAYFGKEVKVQDLKGE